ncbi:MAG TPA: hypothetical protein VKV26_17295 [Dehalococcoidia bacterium]|nr:hypothetical protein [Dehalococcoidia bacterium]
MRISLGKLAIVAAALSLAVAGLGLRVGGVQAAQTVNLVPTPGTDRGESGFAIHDGYAVQIMESGGVPGAQVLFAPCTSTGAHYTCSPGAGTVVTLDSSGAANVALNFNAYSQPLDAVIGTNQADSSDQVIAIFTTTNIPSAYTVPAPLPYSAVTTLPSVATTTAVTQNCFFLPLSGFAPSCFFGAIPGIGTGFVSPVNLGFIPGFSSGFLPGFGFFFVPFGTVTTAAPGGVIFLQPTVQLSAAAVCPAGFHGPLTVVLGGFGFPFGTFFGFGVALPAGAQTVTVFCP